MPVPAVALLLSDIPAAGPGRCETPVTEFEFTLDLVNDPVALEPRTLHTMMSLLVRAQCNQPSNAPVSREFAAGRSSPRSGFQDELRSTSGVAVLPLYGVLSRRAPTWLWPHATNTGIFANVVHAMLADSAVQSLVLDIDSPGGTIGAAIELADLIYSARQAKPVYAVANDLAASAAYWIGSQASQMYVAPGGQAGSIGVYAAHADFSKAFETAGVKTTLISAGKYKTEGNPYEPLSQEARDFVQGQVDGYYDQFVAAVARGRSVAPAFVRQSMGGGRTFLATKAVGARMADGIATLGQVTSRAGAYKGSPAGRAQHHVLDRQLRWMEQDTERFLH